jgi:hypothetical protein
MKSLRLRRVGPTEVVGRVRQEFNKLADRAVGDVLVRPDRAEIQTVVEALFTTPFFRGVTDPAVVALIHARYPEWAKSTVEIAENVRSGIFPLMGGQPFSFGSPVDWHVDPLTRRRAPSIHWTLIDPLDETIIGDSKGVWELNRHQWMVQLGQAYRLTGRTEYAQSVVDYLTAWLEANPPGTGINWASSLEIGYRLISWCWALFLIRDSTALSKAVLPRIMESVWRHAMHVERYLSHYFSPNTHLTGEALALVYAGLIFPKFRNAQRWQRRGMEILLAESRRQILPDGVHFEQATCYQLYTLDIYMHLLLLGSVHGWTAPDDLRERLQRMVDFLVAIRRTDGSIPQIGDDDGGALPPVGSVRPRDFRPMFSTAAALFANPEYAWAAGGLAPETLWLMGAEGAAGIDSLLQEAGVSRRSSVFAHGGYAVLSSGLDADAHHLIFDVGPLGCPISGAHGHADLLSIQCSAFGQNFIVDPGTFSYTGDRDAREFFRGTDAHSTLCIDGRPQADPAGPFSWVARPSGNLRRYCLTDRLDAVEAEHSAYERLADRVHHRRKVVFVRERFWILVDDVTGDDEHRIDAVFQFAPLRVTTENDWLRAQSGGRALLVRVLATCALRREVRESWVSSHYGLREPAPKVAYTAFARLPQRIVTVLFPVRDDAATPPDVMPIGGDGTDLGGIIVGDERIMLPLDGDLRVERSS